jgi:hypothetical protein
MSKACWGSRSRAIGTRENVLAATFLYDVAGAIFQAFSASFSSRCLVAATIDSSRRHRAFTPRT